MVVASPTLAQGIDLACSVLIFRSLRRYEDGEWVPISPAEFANVVGRAGRAFVDLDGIAVLPTFDAHSRSQQHQIFNKLIELSRGQRLLSGLAQVIWQIAKNVRQKIGIKEDAFLEYVLNHHDLWADTRLVAQDESAEDEDDVEDSLEKYVADLDIAIFSIVEPLDTEVDDIAATLDEVLKDSLWKRTLAHLKDDQKDLELALLRSRAEWLWRNSTIVQRQACFYSGLGRKPGLFIHEQLDTLVEVLCSLQAAVAAGDGKAVADEAVKFATLIMAEPFFSVRKLPDKWEEALASWVMGTAFSEILKGRKTRDAQRLQAFIQDGVVFRLVWAAEAARVQAIATEHPRRDELGDGPAYALTYGVPSISAALLCQMGFPSRVGAVWVVRQLDASFKDMEGLRDWMRENDALLDDLEFWESEDHHLLWTHAATPSGAEYPQPWSHKSYSVPVKWNNSTPKAESPMRVIPGVSRSATICGLDLTPLGTVQVPFDPHGAVLSGTVEPAGTVEIQYYGRGS